MKVPLTNSSLVVLVDEEDYDKVTGFSEWYLGTSGYAMGKGYTYLHHFIGGKKAPKGYEWHHKNGNKLDNRKTNLEIVSRSHHAVRHPKRGGNPTSEFKGVCWDSARGKWRATLEKDGRHIYLGRYESEIDAALAYNEAIISHYGNDAYINRILKESDAE